MPADTTPLTDAEIDELEDGVVAGLATAIGNLTVLREAGAHTRRGFPTWHEYVIARFGDLLRQLHLPKDERQALVQSMDDAGKTVRETAAELAVSKSQVGRDRAEIAAKVVQLDERRNLEGRSLAEQPSPAAERDASSPTSDTTAPAPSSVDLVVTLVARARAGYNVHEAARRLRWRQGQTSCALSRAEKRGRLVRTGAFRDGCAVYDLSTAERSARAAA